MFYERWLRPVHADRVRMLSPGGRALVVRSRRHTPMRPKPAGAASDVRREIAAIGRYPRKRLGQHFLADPQTAQRIVRLAAPDAERVVEIGPGLGALSELLVQSAEETWLIEVDAALAERLRAKFAHLARVHVVEADVLAVDFTSLLGSGAPAVLVGNLPYNIGTAVLTAALAQARCFSRMVLTLQREVVERLVAPPGSKTYGALSVLTQFAAQVRPALRIAPGAFVPRPKVESEVVIVEPYGRPPVAVSNPKLFRRLVRTVFTQRRKQLVNSLRPLCSDPTEPLGRAGIDPVRRPETLTLSEFATLSNALAEQDTGARSC
jgi:16S rRNA (adenine1518-N6/adenine1519-N6)-dimethyltransferase